MYTVVVPVDFSDNALHAVRHAIDLFKCHRTDFYFVHAYADEVYGPLVNKNEASIATQKKSIKKKTDKALSALVDDIRNETGNPKHTYRGVSAFESLVDAVNDFVNQHNVDLVVMGTQGQTADKNITFGSHTVQIFKYVQCPVLAIPEHFEFRQPKKILFPTDYMIPYKRRELKLLNNISAQFKSEVHFLYLSDFEDLSHRQLDNRLFLKGSLPNGHLFFTTTPVRNKAQAILETIAEKDIDMLVMVNARHSFLEDMLYRSTVDTIGLQPKVPFLVMQNLPR